MKSTLVGLAAAVITVGAVSTTATASFHLMQVQQVIGGVQGDTNAQAIQLRMRAALQGQVQGAKVWAHDAAGQNPVLLIDFQAPVPIASSGSTILIASPDFSQVTNPAAVPDFTLTNLIPAGYLAAGSITFENNLGSIVYWRLSWGGAGYTGDTTGFTTNDADGEFGPPWSGVLPSSDLQALRFQGLPSAASTSNTADYALTGTAAVFRNNAGVSFTVREPVVPCPEDCAQPANGEVDTVDFFEVIAQWGMIGTSCDLDLGLPGVDTTGPRSRSPRRRRGAHGHRGPLRLRQDDDVAADRGARKADVGDDPRGQSRRQRPGPRRARRGHGLPGPRDVPPPERHGESGLCGPPARRRSRHPRGPGA
jgi:hypothetical protein